MSLRDELLRDEAPPPSGFTLVTPPSWGRFAPTDEGRRALEQILRTRMREVGRPDLDGQLRSMVRQQWDRLRDQRALAIYMPVEPSIDGATPASIVVTPWAARSSDLEADLRDRADGQVERLDTTIGPVFRWVSEVRGAPGVGDVQSRHISYLFPFPVDGARRGALARGVIAHPGAEEGGPVLEALTALIHAILETFRWRA